MCRLLTSFPLRCWYSVWGEVEGRGGGEGAPYSRQTLTSSGAKLELHQFSAARAKSRKVLPIVLEECINKKSGGKRSKL